MRQFIRDVVTGELSLEYFTKRLGSGWKIASIQWVREAEVTEGGSAQFLQEDAVLPYGLQVGENGLVSEHPLEAAVLLLIFDQIVREKRIQEIAIELNRQGYRTRVGSLWSAPEVFELMPRLIEVGPSLLKSTVWQAMRPITPPGNKPAN